MARLLNLYLEHRLVAQLTAIPGDRSILTLTEEYLADEKRPTISLGFKGQTGGIAYEPRTRQTRIDPYLSNLLPEGKLREYIAESDHVYPDREFELLRILGEDLPGGLIARLGNDEEADGATLLANEQNERDDGPIKFSLAGVQMKLSALKDATGGLTIPASGKGGNWIVKFPSEKFTAVPENEYWMMMLAKRVGLPTPDIALVDVRAIAGMPEGIRTDLGRAFVTERFDRANNKRIHMEDFAQIFRVYPTPAGKYRKANYDQIANVIWREMGEAGLSDYVARLVFTAAIGNGDMHVKNWSVLYPDGRTPQLAPVYDYVSTLTYVENEELGLNLAGSKSFEDVTLQSFIALADRVKAPSRLVTNAVRETVERIRTEWEGLEKDAELPKSILKAINDNLERVPLLRTAPKLQKADLKPIIAGDKQFHADRVLLIGTKRGAVQTLGGAILTLHVFPAHPEPAEFVKLAAKPELFPPMPDTRPRDHRLDFEGLLTGSNSDGLEKPQRAYVRVFRTGIVESVVSNLARGRNDDALVLPNIQAMIIKYTYLYTRALASADIGPPYIAFCSLVGVRDKRFLQDFIENALVEDIPQVKLALDRYDFVEGVLDKVPSSIDDSAKQIHNLLTHLANTAGLSTSPYFDEHGHYLLQRRL